MERESDPSGPSGLSAPSLRYYGAATCGGGVDPGGTYPARRGCWGPHAFRGPGPAGRQRGRRLPEPRDPACAREQPAAPALLSARGPGQLGLLPRVLAPSSAAENPSGGGSLPRSPGKSGGGRQGSPSGQGEAARAPIPDLDPEPGAPNLGPSVQSPPPIFSPQSARTTAT